MKHEFEKTDTCAILIFAKSTVLESTSKRILTSNKRNFDLWDKLTHKTLKIAKQSKIPYFISDENSQNGENFGEKIAHSIQTIFNKGFDKVIVIGNDCIELNERHLKIAELKLQKNDFVFGPDFKGGSYLLGISKNEFETSDFENFNWQSNTLFENLIHFYKNKQTFILPFLNDVNDTFSFKKATAKLFFDSKFKADLQQLIEFFSNAFVEVYRTFNIVKIIYKKHRGPPIIEI